MQQQSSSVERDFKLQDHQILGVVGNLSLSHKKLGKTSLKQIAKNLAASPVIFSSFCGGGCLRVHQSIGFQGVGPVGLEMIQFLPSPFLPHSAFALQHVTEPDSNQ